MRRRSTDDHDQITEAEVKKARATPFQWATLFLTNLPVMVKIVALLGIGAGTAVTAPKVYQTWNGEQEEPLPIPDGQVITPDAAQAEQFRAQLRQSLEAMKSAIDSNTAAVEALRAADGALEVRIVNESKAGDSRLEQRVNAIETLVQP